MAKTPTRHKVYTVVKANRADRSGIACKFYKVTDKIGVKIFRSKRQAEKCFKLHKFLSSLKATKKLVPRVYGKLFSFKKEWAYFVEICVPADSYGYNINYDCLEGVIDKLENKAVDKFPEWMNWIRSIFMDDHNGNFGYIGRRMVWLDFSV